MSENVSSDSVATVEATPEAESAPERVDTDTYQLFGDTEIDGGESTGDLHEVKILGETKKIPYEELVAGYQKGQASDQKFRESSDLKKKYSHMESENTELRRNTEALIQQLKSDPFSVLGHKSLGLDVEKLLYDKMNEKMEYEEMDDYERENLDLRRKVERYETQDKQTQEQKAQADSSARQTQYANNITSALQEAGITATPDTIRVAAGHLYNSAEKTGSPTITWREMVDKTKVSLKEEAQRVYGGFSPEQLSEYLGDDVVSKIRKHSIQKVKNNFNLNQPDVKAENVRRMPKTQMSKEEFRERINKIKQNLA
jgi:hypothetical protein